MQAVLETLKRGGRDCRPLQNRNPGKFMGNMGSRGYFGAKWVNFGPRQSVKITDPARNRLRNYTVNTLNKMQPTLSKTS